MIAISIISTVRLKIYLPWHTETAVAMLVWFELGLIVKDYCPDIIYNETSSKIKLSVLAALSVLIGGSITFFNVHNVSVRRNEYGYILNYLSSCALLIIGFCLIAKLIGNNRLLEYIGKNSLGILLFHKFPILLFQELIPFTKQYMDIRDTPISILIGVLVTVISICVSLLATEICRKVFPPLVGAGWKNKREINNV